MKKILLQMIALGQEVNELLVRENESLERKIITLEKQNSRLMVYLPSTKQIDELIDLLLEENDDEPIPIKELVDIAVSKGFKKETMVREIDELTRRGILFEPETGHVKKP